MSDLFDDYGIISQGIRNVSPKEAFELNRHGALIVDLRDTDFSDFKAFDVQGVTRIPFSQIKESCHRLPTDRSLILADSSGLKSKEAVKFLQEKNFQRVANMSGGFVEWERDGMPVKTDVDQRLSGSCACQLKPREKHGLKG